MGVVRNSTDQGVSMQTMTTTTDTDFKVQWSDGHGTWREVSGQRKMTLIEANARNDAFLHPNVDFRIVKIVTEVVR